jgi:AcrR family transcriptional regulator
MTRDRIFAAAKEIFEREGLEGLSMRKVAGEVGLTPMALYRHFADKDALIDALMLDGFQAWEARVKAISEPEPRRRFERLLEAFLDFALEDPHRFDAAFLLRARGARQYPDDMIAGRSPALAAMFERIEAAKAQGLLGETPTFEIALSVSALAQGFVSMHRAGRFTDEAVLRRLYRNAIGHLIGSFAKHGGTPS